MKNSLKKITLFFLLISVFFAQAQKIHEVVTFNPKIGLYIASGNHSFNKNSGGVLGFEVVLRRNTLVHSISVLRVKEIVFFGPKPANTFHQLDYLFGKYYDDKGRLRLQYQAGVGLLFGYERDKFLYRESGGFLGTDHYSSKWYTAIALPIKIGLKRLLKNANTFGLDLQININKKNIIFMPLLSYEF